MRENAGKSRDLKRTRQLQETGISHRTRSIVKGIVISRSSNKSRGRGHSKSKFTTEAIDQLLTFFGGQPQYLIAKERQTLISVKHIATR